jgi:hypothetical protein
MTSDTQSLANPKLPLVIPTQSANHLARLVMRNDAGEVIQQWLVRQNKSTLGHASSCALRCTAPGIAPYHALIVLGARQTFLRALAPRVRQHGKQINELLIHEDECEFEIAGYRFTITRRLDSQQPPEDDAVSRERLRFTLARPHRLTNPHGSRLARGEPTRQPRDAADSSLASGPTGNDQVRTKSTRQLDSAAASSRRVTFDWIGGEKTRKRLDDWLEDALAPIERRLQDAIAPIIDLHHEARIGQQGDVEQQRSQDIAESTRSQQALDTLLHQEQASRRQQQQEYQALREHISTIVARQNASVESLNERIADVNHQLSLIEKIVLEERSREEELSSSTSDGHSQQLTALEHVQNQLVSLSDSLVQARAVQQEIWESETSWKRDFAERLDAFQEQLTQSNSQTELPASIRETLEELKSLQSNPSDEIAQWSKDLHQRLGDLQTAIEGNGSRYDAFESTAIERIDQQTTKLQTLSENLNDRLSELRGDVQNSVAQQARLADQLKELESAHALEHESSKVWQQQIVERVVELQETVCGLAIRAPVESEQILDEEPHPESSALEATDEGGKSHAEDDHAVVNLEEEYQPEESQPEEYQPEEYQAEEYQAEEYQAEEYQAEEYQAEEYHAEESHAEESQPEENIEAVPNLFSGWSEPETPSMMPSPVDSDELQYSADDATNPDLQIPDWWNDEPLPEPEQDANARDDTVDDEDASRHLSLDGSDELKTATDESQDPFANAFDLSELDSEHASRTSEADEDAMGYSNQVLLVESDDALEAMSATELGNESIHSITDGDPAEAPPAAVTDDEASFLEGLTLSKDSSDAASPVDPMSTAVVESEAREAMATFADPESESAVPAMTEGQSSTETDSADESVEDYMKKLLARMRGVSESEVEIPATVKEADATGRQKPPEPMHSTAQHGMPSADNSAPSQEYSSNPAQGSSEYSNSEWDQSTEVGGDDLTYSEAPKQRLAPETNTDLAAMRDLANSSARTAISKSNRQRSFTSAMLKLALASVGMTVGSVLIAINGFAVNIALVAAIACFIVALIWGFDGVCSMRPMLHSGIVLRPSGGEAADQPMASTDPSEAPHEQ